VVYVLYSILYCKLRIRQRVNKLVMWHKYDSINIQRLSDVLSDRVCLFISVWLCVCESVCWPVTIDRQLEMLLVIIQVE